MVVTFMRPNLWIVVVVERKAERFLESRLRQTANISKTQADTSLNQEINWYKI